MPTRYDAMVDILVNLLMLGTTLVGPLGDYRLGAEVIFRTEQFNGSPLDARRLGSNSGLLHGTLRCLWVDYTGTSTPCQEKNRRIYLTFLL